jgi:hypothetical protein
MGYRFDSFDPNGALIAAEEQDDGSYWGRHWRGHLPLPQTYWLNGFLTNMVIGGLGLAFVALEHTGRSLRLISFGFLLYVLLALIARSWSLVGIWRSAGRHAARGGTPGWGTVARIMVVLGLLVTLGQMPSLALQTKEYGLIALGRDPIGPLAAMTLDEKGKTLQLKGPLSAGVADRLEEVLKSAPAARTVVLDSEGGRIFEALRMANLIKARGLDTRVEQHCASACTLILLAGKERSAHKFAQIGFHQPDFPGLSEEEKNEIIADNRKEYVDAGIGPEFLDRALSTPPTEMWYPTHADMVDAGVLTSEEITVGSSKFDKRRLGELLSRMESDAKATSGEMVDELTRLDGAELSGSRLTIHHSLTRAYSKSEAKRLQANLQANITGELCDSPRRSMIEMGASFGFDYADPNGTSVAKVLVDDCPAASDG